MSATELAQALQDLRHRVAALRLALVTPGADEARRAQQEMVGQVDDYLVPRLDQLDAPLLAVVGGSTGAGKSTLVNTLVGADVTKAGWLRPTTRGPVLVCSPEDLRWFTGNRILPDLSRTTGDAGSGGTHDQRTVHVVAHPGVPAGLALLDAPDIDSVVAENRRLAAQLLAAADLWIFCTTAARYADAVPWELLRTAQQRSTALAVVLNRVPPEGVREIGQHLRAMLTDNGLARTPVFAVPETALDAENSQLPEEIVATVREWLTRLAGDAEARSAVIRETLDGALRSLRRRVTTLVREAEDQASTASVLRAEAEEAYDEALLAIDDGIRSGSVLRGEVLARWQEFVGTGEFTRGLEQRIGQLRDRVTAFLTGRRPPVAPVQEALESGLQTLVRSAADGAAEQTHDAWRVRPAGRALLAAREPELSHSSDDFRPTLEQELRAWQGRVLELVAQEGGQKRTMARLASFGTNGAGLVLMLAVFAQTGGLSGVEILVAGGTSAAGQKVLEAVFGDSAVRMLAARARTDLMDRVEELLATERRRFTELVDAAVPPAEAVIGLRDSLETFERARLSMHPPAATGSGGQRAAAPTRPLGRDGAR